MAENAPQNLDNHARFDPIFHFFALPVVLLSVIAAIVHLVQRPNWFSAWLVLFVMAVVVVTVKARSYALRVQDRLIRLEERERLTALLAEPLRSRVEELTEAQLIGLRFACDTEIPSLVAETLTKQLARRDIKKRIKTWRGDYFRV
jgi:hypothetical protein